MTTVTLTDETQLACQATLDAKAFGALYDHYFPRVYNYVRFRVLDVSSADDLTAIIFTRALDRLHTYQPGKAPFGAWLFRIAHNAVIDHFRTRSRRPTVPLDQATTLSPVPPPEVEIERQEETAALLTALATLGQREQEVVALKFAGGLANQQIAEIAGLKSGHVGVILFRAIRKLHHHLTVGEEI